MKDFGDDAYSGDCFEIVGKLNGLNCSNSKDFVEILQTINCDLHLGMDDGGISFVAQEFTKPIKSIIKINPVTNLNNPKRQSHIPLNSKVFRQRKCCFGNSTASRRIY